MFNTTLTILLLMLSGYIFSAFEKNRSEAERILNKYLYYLALPAIVIFKIAGTNIREIGFAFIAVNSIPLIAMMLAVYLFWKAGVFKLNFARTLIILSTLGNTVYFGFPVVNSFLGGGALGYAAIITSLHNLVIFTVGFIFINLISEDELNLKIFGRHIFRNAVFVSSIFAVLISYFSIPISAALMGVLEEISKTTLPVSLFTIGVALYGKRITRHRLKELLAVSFFKMILLPFIAAFSIYLFQGSSIEFKASFIEYTMPLAVLAFVVAKELEFDSDLVAQAVVFTTLLYFPFLPLVGYFLRLIF